MKSIKLILITLVLLFTAVNAQDGKNYTETFDAKPGENLRVNLELGGSVIVEGWSKNSVEVKGYIKYGRIEDIDVVIEKTSDGVKINVEKNYRDHVRNFRCKFKIMVPEKYNLDLYTAGGSVDLKNVDGIIDGKTMGGAIDFSRISGKVDFVTMGGAVRVNDCKLEGNIKTMGGSLDINEVTGALDITTMGGSIKVSNVKMASAKRDGVSISTMGGSIDVDGSEYGVKIETKGGSISAYDVKEFVEAETMGGSIKLRRIDGSVDARTMGGSIYCEVIGDSDNKDITLVSKGGDIELTVPSDFDMEFDIQIKISGGHYNDEFEIISDFEMDKRSSKDDDDRRNRYTSSRVTGEGKNGSGKNKVRIKTVNGNVYLKKN